MYILNGMTLLMVANRCDFNRDCEEHLDLEDDPETQLKNQKFFVVLRKVMLYYLVPGLMLFAVFSKLKYQEDWCKASKICTLITCFLCYVVFIYALAKTLMDRYNDPSTPKKYIIMWIYLIVAMLARQSEYTVQGI